MAVTLYKRKGSNVWHAQWVDPRGRRHQRSTRLTRRRDAEELAARWEREALRDPADVAREQAVFGDALDLLEEHLRASVAAGTMAEATALFHQAKATQLVRVFTNDRLLSTLGPAAVRDYCTARRAAKVPASDHTLVKELTTLRLALRLARERALWAGDLDAVQPAELAARYVPRKRVLSAADIDALRAHLPNRRWRVVAWALATGAEYSAWARAERGDHQLLPAERFQAWQRGEGREVPAGLVRVRGTKRASRDRWVPVVLPRCAELLAEALGGGDQAPPKLWAPWPKVHKSLNDAVAKANKHLEAGAKMEPLSPNDLRRTFATWHVEAGVSLELLARSLGHTSTAMLWRVYGRPSPERIGELMAAQVRR